MNERVNFEDWHVKILFGIDTCQFAHFKRIFSVDTKRSTNPVTHPNQYIFGGKENFFKKSEHSHGAKR